ncbi:MAG: hypothetical protein H0U74_10185, partial [Bradymonadaceae bacterium]|nr:hypothetical protein [Lujinxingiaceae bacterium]
MRALVWICSCCLLLNACTSNPGADPADAGSDLQDDTPLVLSDTTGPDTTGPDVFLADTNPTPDITTSDVARDSHQPSDVGGELCELYSEPGPYVVGMSTIELDGASLEIWYPVDRGDELGASRARYDLRDWLPDDARAMLSGSDALTRTMDAYRDLAISDAGPFPVVLFSHGLAGYRMQSSFLTVHLASWGFVVAAPDHRERGLAQIVTHIGPSGDNALATLRQTRDHLESENERSASRLFRKLDLGRLAAIGHSDGARAALALGADSEISALVALAPT